ncbi:hypothetical protein HYH02_009548 [Chlamydomonas schloesseri]|uniref:Uncharacterized protein n=1 Tax=Chlamydomonas schloesseri TaxID=2026947 RepID=A0A835TCV2_9CHLO|nr:hypothetical protein HYH02_009548 [Chlamydomonas schloesseri]|eukprot:KAG2443137.1 hypothetical protein HYH02_009548 [Chlamydomonas schloesseri]
MTPFSACAANVPAGSSANPLASPLVVQDASSPAASPARQRPAPSGPGRAESPARPSALRASVVAGIQASTSVRKSDNGIFAAVHAASAFNNLTARSGSITAGTSHRRSQPGTPVPARGDTNNSGGTILARKAAELASKELGSGPPSPGGGGVERSGGSMTGGSGTLKGLRGAPQVLLGDRSVAEVVANFVKPESAPFKHDYLTGIITGQARLDGVEGDVFAADLHERDGNVEYWRRATGEKIFGHVDYFVSHCWQYKLGDLVSMILQHYDELPETDGGRLYVPVFYWVDIFAVTQHFVGDIKDHPDCDFPGVIRQAKGGVLFSMAPWRNPLSVRRVWCLFEALTALSISRDINLLTDPFDSTAKVDTLLPLFTRQVVDMLDVRNAEATVEKDRDYILNLAERTLGINTFNSKLRQALHHEICEAMILRAVVTGETEEGRKLLERGIIISNATLRFMPKRDSAGKEIERIRDSGLLLLAEAVKACPNLQSLVVYTAPETDVSPSGLTALAKGLAGHQALKHLSVGRHPSLASAPGTGGSLGRTSVSAYAGLLTSNPQLSHLDLSYNKLGPDGVAALAPALNGNRTVSVLKLRQVGMDSGAALTLADCLATAEALRDLDISFNPEMGDKAGPALLKLMSHKGLQVLRAQSCRFGMQVGKVIIGDPLTKSGSVKELCLGCFVQPGQTASSQDAADWNLLLVDTAPTAGKATLRSPARGEVMVALAGALRQGFKTLERLDLRGCFVGANVGGESAGLRDALISGLSSVRRGAAFGSLRQLDLRSCNQPELLKMDDSQIALLLKHGGLNLLIKDYKRTGIKGGVLRQYVQYDA